MSSLIAALATGLMDLDGHKYRDPPGGPLFTEVRCTCAEANLRGLPYDPACLAHFPSGTEDS